MKLADTERQIGVLTQHVASVHRDTTGVHALLPSARVVLSLWAPVLKLAILKRKHTIKTLSPGDLAFWH